MKVSICENSFDNIIAQFDVTDKNGGCELVDIRIDPESFKRTKRIYIGTKEECKSFKIKKEN